MCASHDFFSPPNSHSLSSSQCWEPKPLGLLPLLLLLQWPKFETFPKPPCLFISTSTSVFSSPPTFMTDIWRLSKGELEQPMSLGGGTVLEPSKGGSKAAESKNKGREGSSCWTLWFWIPIIWFKNYNPRFHAFVVLFRSGLVVVNFGSLQFQFVENLEINFSNSISVLKGSNEVQHFLLFACSPLFRFTSVFSSVSIQPGRRRFQSLITARCCSRDSFSVWCFKLPFGALKSLTVFQLF